MKLFKYLLYTFFLIFTLSVFFPQYIPGKNFIVNFVQTSLPENLYSFVKVVYQNKRSTNRLNNDYNEKFLPETQFTNLNYEIIPVKNLSITGAGYAKNLKVQNVKTFYLDRYKNKIILKSKYGNNFFYKSIDELRKKELEFVKIKSNLDENRILDILVDNNILYLSSVNIKNNCEILNLYRADINLKNLNFKKFFNSSECISEIQSGRIQKINKDGKNLIYLSTAAADLNKGDKNNSKPQSDSSIFGKIIEINVDNLKYKIFSKGHRNILGLYVDKNIILATENGPRGGDEINKIEKNKNYGWDIASYGENYKKTDSNEKDYKNSHEDFGFEEPLISFVPSIGISEIIKIDNNFSKKWQNNYLVASLNYKHLLRVKFNNSFTKTIYVEKIFIGERIRDLIYLEEDNIILFAMESSGSIGFLQSY